MSTLNELKAQKSVISKQIAEMALAIHDEDQKGLLLQELNEQLESIENEIMAIKAEEQNEKEAKKLAKKSKKK